jgi:holin-like protein
LSKYSVSVPWAALRHGTLAAYLHLNGGPSDQLASVGTTLVDHLGLLFVPAGTAIVMYTTLLASEGIAIIAA